MSDKIKKTWAYNRMNVDELAEATKEFDQEFTDEMFPPITGEERAWWNRLQREDAKKQPQRRSRTMSIRVAPPMEKEIDRLAKEWKLSRGGSRSPGIAGVFRRPPETGRTFMTRTDGCESM